MTLRQRSFWGVLSVAGCAAPILILYHCTVHAHTLLWEPYGYSELLINYSDGFCSSGVDRSLAATRSTYKFSTRSYKRRRLCELRRAAFSIGVAGIPQGWRVAGLLGTDNSGRRVPHGGHVSDLLSQRDVLLFFAGIVCDRSFGSPSCTRACAAPGRILRCVFYLVCKCRVCACARSVCLSGCAGDAVRADSRHAYDAQPGRLATGAGPADRRSVSRLNAPAFRSHGSVFSRGPAGRRCHLAESSSDGSSADQRCGPRWNRVHGAWYSPDVDAPLYRAPDRDVLVVCGTHRRPDDILPDSG